MTGDTVSVANSPEQVLVIELRKWRERRGLRVVQLVDRVATLGGSLSRQAIGKIEDGERKVTLDELAALAWALDVPPIFLILPLGTEPVVRVLPGRDVPTWDAFRWWVGEIGIEGTDDAGRKTLGWYRDHDKLADAVRWNRGNDQPDLAESFAEELRKHRGYMRRAGVLPPQLPADLVDVEPEADRA